MEAIILVIHLIIAISIIAIVLVQPAESGGFMGSSGSMSNMTARRGTGDTLTRITSILAGTFFVTSLSLALIAKHNGPTKSILDIAADQPPAVEKVVPPTPVDEKTVPVTSAAPKAVKSEEHKKEKPTAPISK